MDFYGVLGVSTNATQDEIKAAFRKKAMECHPDRCFESDASQRFNEIKEAYDALTNPNYKPNQKTSATPHKNSNLYKKKYRKSNNPENWIIDAPPPTHDVWGNPCKNDRDIEQKQEVRTLPKNIPIQKREPEVDLWKSTETQKSLFNKKYWLEYNRLKKTMAYDEPDRFWKALDDWMKKYPKS